VEIFIEVHVNIRTESLALKVEMNIEAYSLKIVLNI